MTQEKALKMARKLYGKTAFTEDTINYRRVGYVKGHKTVAAIGDTWDDAFAELGKKGDKH
jgi:hypothetical protein